MSEEEKPVLDAVGEAGKRRAATVDLPKDAVREIDGGSASTGTAATSPAGEPDRKAKSDPVRTFIESRLEIPVAPPQPDAPPAKSRRGAGLVGGAVAGGLFGALAAYGFGLINPPPAPVQDPRIAVLEGAVGSLDKRLGTSIPEVERLSAALKAAQAEIKALDVRPPATPRAVEERLTALDGIVAGIKEQAGDALRKIGDIEKLAAATPADTGAAPSQAPRMDLAPLAARLVKVETALEASGAATVAATASLAALDARLKGQEQTVATLSVPKPQSVAAAILPVTAIARRALENGEPLGRALLALAALGTSKDALAPLAGFTDTPAPGLSRLVADWSAQLAKLPPPPAVAPAQPSKDMSIADRLKANVSALVEIRPAGTAPATPAQNPLAQATAQLRAGNLEAFGKTVALLPEEVRLALAPVISAAARRQAALKAIVDIEDAALTSAALRN